MASVHREAAVTEGGRRKLLVARLTIANSVAPPRVNCYNWRAFRRWPRIIHASAAPDIPRQIRAYTLARSVLAFRILTEAGGPPPSYRRAADDDGIEPLQESNWRFFFSALHGASAGENNRRNNDFV